jgi:putative PIN family toxin of toxin-antitoxin system
VRVVVDTNVLLSGLFFRGVPRELYLAWIGGRFVGVLTSEILDEYRRAASTFLGVGRDPEIERALQLVLASSHLIDATPLPHPVCRDPGDDKFISCALFGRAECSVSGDKDLTVLRGKIPVAIMSPRQFVARLSENSQP